PAFQAALDVIATDTRRAVQNRGGIIQVPPGVYLLNGNLLIQDTVILQGVAADYFQLHSAGELRFAAGCGIVVMGSREATGHRGDATKIQDLTVYGKKLTIARNGEELPVPLWQYASDYVVGDIVVLPHGPATAYESV